MPPPPMPPPPAMPPAPPIEPPAPPIEPPAPPIEPPAPPIEPPAPPPPTDPPVPPAPPFGMPPMPVELEVIMPVELEVGPEPRVALPEVEVSSSSLQPTAPTAAAVRRAAPVSTRLREVRRISDPRGQKPTEGPASGDACNANLLPHPELVALVAAMSRRCNRRLLARASLSSGLEGSRDQRIWELALVRESGAR